MLDCSTAVLCVVRRLLVPNRQIRDEEARRMVDEARTTFALGGCNPGASC